MSFKALVSRFLNPFGLGSSIQKSTKTKGGWITFNGAINALTAAARLFWASKPESDTTNGLVVIELQPNIRTVLQFAGYAAGDPVGLTADINAWLVHEHQINNDATMSEALGTPAFTMALAVGDITIPTTASLHPGGANVAKWVSTITVTNDHTIGGVVVKDSTILANTPATARFDSESKRFLVLEIACGVDLEGLLPIVRQY